MKFSSRVAPRWVPVVILSIVALSIAASGCVTSKSSSSKPRWVKSELYFGTSIPAGGQVSDAQFQQFLETVVTKEFPDGLTAIEAYGQMKRGDGSITRQPTKVVLLVHVKSKASSDAVQRIISTYRSQFGKPQVMYLSSDTNPQFFGD